jgi:pimeloyl-ACP methyl ester carboxylesterase
MMRGNPSFSLTHRAAQAALREMRTRPKPLARPLLLLSGLVDANLGPHLIKLRIGRCFTDPQRIGFVHFYGCSTIAQARQRVIDAAHRLGGGSVDLLGHSFGALLGVHVATRIEDRPPPLDVRRIFSLAGPMTGARFAKLPALLDFQREMRPGSAFYRELWSKTCDAEIVPYTRLHDWFVGEEHTAPPGRVAWWLDKSPLETAHVQIVLDGRVLADVARRLRGETPFTTNPPAALP